MNDTGGSTNEQVARDIALHPTVGNAELTKRQIEFLDQQAELQRSQLEQLDIEKQKLREEIDTLRSQQKHLSVQDEVLHVQKHQLAAHERHLHIEHTRERLHIGLILSSIGERRWVHRANIGRRSKSMTPRSVMRRTGRSCISTGVERSTRWVNTARQWNATVARSSSI